MSDINVEITDAQPINIDISNQEAFHVGISDEHINVDFAEEQPINIEIADEQPIEINLADNVNIIYADGGSDKNYVQDFTMAHTLNIQHNLQKYPSATVMNSAGDFVVATVRYLDINNLIVQFTAPFSGRLTLN